MEKKYKRKEFLKMAILANAALYAKPLLGFGHSFLPETAPADGVIYYRKGEALYEELRKGFNKRIDKFPQVIALCTSAVGVSEAVKYAAANKLAVTVKSGGHCMEGFSCNDGGMVINLSGMNTAILNGETLSTGPGATLASLYDIMLPKGRIIPGGSCAGVGIGGLTLGGGYGLLARKFGLTCDSLQEVTMVDGRGNIVSSASNKELLWACKGGGNGNFGVITSMKFKTHPAPATLQSYRFKSFKVNTEKAKSILQQWFSVSAKLPPSCFSAYVLNGKTVYILLTNADKEDAVVADVVKQLSGISDKTTKTKPQPLSPALKVFYGRRDPLYFKNASAGLYKSFEQVAPCIDKVIDIVLSTPGMIYQVNTLGGNIQRPELEPTSAFPHRAFPFFSELQTYWDTPKQAPRLLERFQQVQTVFTAQGITAQYRNYPDINFSNWETAYYGNNYRRLQQVKNKFDPDNLFRGDQALRNGK